MNTSNDDVVGVLVARFQGERLHQGWLSIIDSVCTQHPNKMLIVLGDHGGQRTEENPLTYEERVHMIREFYPDPSIKILRLMDHQISSVYWSNDLDALIMRDHPKSSAIVYGSRKRVIEQYSGKFDSRTITPKEKYSERRTHTVVQAPMTEAGRAAIIYSLKNRRPTVYSAADIAIVDAEKKRVLLISKKKWAGLWAFPGGFAEPNSVSDKDDAMREQCEEVLGVTAADFTCLTPDRLTVDDPRYRHARKDKIRSTLYVARYVSGTPVGGDDAEVAEWFDLSELQAVLVPWHQPFGRVLNEHMLDR